MIKIILLSVMLTFGCMINSDNKTINISLNPKKSGWYFIQIEQDSTLSDTGSAKISFNDTIRLITVHINHIEKTILSPYDRNGNSLSSRLKYLGILEAKKKKFFEFYNPTDEELVNINKWMASDKRAWQIQLNESAEFEKIYKNQ